jgi:hypothetical protein
MEVKVSCTFAMQYKLINGKYNNFNGKLLSFDEKQHSLLGGLQIDALKIAIRCPDPL